MGPLSSFAEEEGPGGKGASAHTGTAGRSHGGRKRSLSKSDYCARKGICILWWSRPPFSLSSFLMRGGISLPASMRAEALAGTPPLAKQARSPLALSLLLVPRAVHQSCARKLPRGRGHRVSAPSVLRCCGTGRTATSFPGRRPALAACRHPIVSARGEESPAPGPLHSQG